MFGMVLSHLLQPKSSLQIFRLGFFAARARCCSSLPQLSVESGVEETKMEPFLEESSEKEPGLFSKATFSRHEEATYDGPHKAKTLADLFLVQKDDQTEITAENEGTQPEEALSDLILNCVENKNEDSDSSQSNDLLPIGQAGDSQDGHLKVFSPDECENDQPEYEGVSYEEGEMPSPSNRSQKLFDLKDYMKSNFNQAASEIDKSRSLTFTDEPLEKSDEAHHNQDTEKLPVIRGLIELIRVQKDIPSNSTMCSNKTGLVKENSLNANLQKSDNNDRLSRPDFPAGTPRAYNKKNSNSDISIDFTDSKARLNVSFPTSNKDQKQLNETCFSRKESEENKVLVSFLRHFVPESHIRGHFYSCGEILGIEFPKAEGPLFKTAYIYFKTRKGLDEALKKSGSVLRGCSIHVESATSTKNLKIAIPSLIGDHDIPPALVKNPTRTIKIEQLTRQISSDHIEKALTFCESNVSRYLLGSSHSVAYVEFETETGKERALAKQSINVLGRRLVLLKIDSPRTTVVRISNFSSLELSKLLSICRPLGEVTSCQRRNTNVVDVQFGLAEWPNMLKILNRVNGFEIEGRQLQAEPAPVFPPDILVALLRQPEERKSLKDTVQVLLRKLRENPWDTSELASLQHAFIDKL